MARLYTSVIRWFCTLELYEIAGLTSCLASLGIFFGFDTHLDRIFAVEPTHIKVLNDIYAVYQNPMSWTFTFVLLLFLLIPKLSGKIRMNPSIPYLARIAITFLVLAAIYKIVNFYIAVFNPFDRDFVITHIDKLMFFGKLPSQWLQPYVNPVFDIIFSLSYLSWFVLVYATVIVMMRKSHHAVREYLSTAIITFYLGYTVYFFVPAIGPVFTVHYTTPIGRLPQLLVMGQTILSRDCFPSLHTGLSIVMAVNVWRHHRKWSWLYTPLAALIIMSTIYLRVHYFLDVVAGASLAIITTQLSPYLVEYWELARTKLLQKYGFATATRGVSEAPWPDLAQEWQ